MRGSSKDNAPPTVTPPAEGDTSAVPEVQPVLVITVARDGATFVGGAADGKIRDRVREYVSSGSRRVVIMGDNDAPYGAVIDAAGEAQAAGANVAFGVQVK